MTPEHDAPPSTLRLRDLPASLDAPMARALPHVAAEHGPLTLSRIVRQR